MKISAFSYRLGATSTALFLGFFLSAPNAFASPLSAILKAAFKNSIDPSLIKQSAKSAVDPSIVRRTVIYGGISGKKRYLVERECRKTASYYKRYEARQIYNECINKRFNKRNY